MLAQERRNLILERLQEDKSVVVSELSQLYEVSEETIRRDLDKLEKGGYATKSYGGAVANENMSIDMPFNVRKKRNILQKKKIAMLAEQLIENGDHIILDASTTAVSIAKAIKHKKNLTVITNSIEIMIELADVPDWTIISTGGRLREGYLALVGPRVAEGLQSYHVEKAFISCKGVDISNGFTDGNEDFASAKSIMLHRAKEKVLAIDSSKFDTVGFAHIGNVEDLDYIITDCAPAAKWLDFFKKINVQCIYPD